MHPSKNLSIVIPLAGLGRRMKSFGPKSLITLRRGQTVLRRQRRREGRLRDLYPRSEVIVVLGHEAEQIRPVLPRYVKVVFNSQYETTNVGHSLWIGVSAATRENVLIVYGDLVFNRTLVSLPDLSASLVVVDTRGQMTADEVGVNVVDGEALQFSYGLTQKWAQVVLLAGKDKGIFLKVACPPERARFYGFELLNLAIDRGTRFLVYSPARGRVAEIDRPTDTYLASQIT